MAITKPTQVVTGTVRLSFVHLFTPYAQNPGQEPKYSCTILLPKSDTAIKARIDAAIEAAKQEGAQSKWGGIVPPVLKICVHDGDGARPSDGQPFGDECKGHWVFTGSNKQAPGVVDAGVNPIMDQSEIYSGMYGRVSVNFFPYNSNGNKGIGCGLNNVQKVSDGEPLGGRTSPTDDFGPASPGITPAYGAAQSAAAPVAAVPQMQQGAAQYAAATQQAFGQAPQQMPAIDPITGMPRV